MKIHDDHMFHGSALIQIAEHPRFTAINSLKLTKTILRNSYLINDGIGVSLKYAQKPTNRWKEYVFTFNKGHMKELSGIDGVTERSVLDEVFSEVQNSILAKLRQTKLSDVMSFEEKAVSSLLLEKKVS